MAPTLRRLPRHVLGSEAYLSVRVMLALALIVALFPDRQVRAVDQRSWQHRPVSYRNDVVPLLAKAGCNMGACHGNSAGKGGFRLSLRGDDPEFDFRSLTRDLGGRRLSTAAPDQSLMLLKPTGQLPHEGGIRFAADSDEAHTLHDWIAAG
ncbi:MAG: hypothetical protein ACLPZF_19830 [Candidatus Acidiferrales bacterium]